MASAFSTSGPARRSLLENPLAGTCGLKRLTLRKIIYVVKRFLSGKNHGSAGDLMRPKKYRSRRIHRCHFMREVFQTEIPHFSPAEWTSRTNRRLLVQRQWPCAPFKSEQAGAWSKRIPSKNMLRNRIPDFPDQQGFRHFASHSPGRFGLKMYSFICNFALNLNPFSIP